MTQDFPVWCEMHDWYIPDLDYMWWNKVASGAFRPTLDTTSVCPKYSFDGSPRELQYSLYVVSDYAIVMEHVFTYVMQSTRVWNDAFAQSNHVGVSSLIRTFFAKSLTKELTTG